MGADVEPPELARLLDAAERPRSANWSLRAALTRYAQPEPQRSSDVIELLRRIEGALRPHAKLLERSGPSVWAALHGSAECAGDGRAAVEPSVLELLRLLRAVDELGDELAAWAVDRGAGARPDGAVDNVVHEVSAALDQLRVPHEEPPRPRGGRG